MRSITEIKSVKRIKIVDFWFYGMACYLTDKQYKEPREMAIIASWGGGWEHVSVSLRNRCPTWEEMCRVTVLTGAEETGLDPGEYAEYLVGKAAECSDRLRHIWG